MHACQLSISVTHSEICLELLQDDAKALKEYGVHSKTRLLVMRTAKAAASSKLANQEDRALRLTRLRDAAAAVASRGDGRFPANHQQTIHADTEYSAAQASMNQLSLLQCRSNL